MQHLEVPYNNTGYFSKIVMDYLEEKKELAPFYHRYPKLQNFEAQIQEKAASFSSEHRKVLVSALEKQYQEFSLSGATQEHINHLVLPNAFTITTGHQLNLFSGPLYFLYKIISVINLCKELKQTYPKQHFVPMYWMASEDHDFEEIQYFNTKGTQIKWETNSGGPVGRLSTDGLEEVYNKFAEVLNNGKNAEELRDLFQKAYVEHQNLADASRYLVNVLFGEHGVVVIDGDDPKLKSLFKPYALKELVAQTTYQQVTKTNQQLTKQGYPNQVNVREINLFYIADGLRERVVKEGNGYRVNNTDLHFSCAEHLFSNVDKLEFLSGNALLRPLYQEVILPNLCYVGGGGELAYWMQLKATFASFNVPFPMLLLRNSALLVTEKQLKKIEKLEVTVQDLFANQHTLIKKIVNQRSTINFNFEEKKQILEANFKELESIAGQTDASFIGAVKAQKAKQIKGLETLEKRLLKAEKKRMYEYVTRLEILQNQLFPNHSLQERQVNFSQFYEVYGKEMIATLLTTLKPLEKNFSIVVL
ncbi:bacillithiol biosynthesis cysteine-adding enzyme BshC [Ochrovirga pacifica]|uniref:bacillithiol biosynthesis cysteine-adding enzyme BshC n=1 Tax=Ochrovirga pacifica TaxID=1042376 RepID=UPI0002557F7D|nr:bacillithiol biosynthesis cysteine-adding enzyme BshC [Ochrovirga pacifica]